MIVVIFAVTSCLTRKDDIWFYREETLLLFSQVYRELAIWDCLRGDVSFYLGSLHDAPLSHDVLNIKAR